jgi:thioester reductase-like protein
MLTGHSQTGAAQTGDLLCRIIKGLVQMEVAPEMNAWINMTPVDYASRAIVHLSKQVSTFGQCFHVVNPVAIPWNYLLHEIRMAGYPLQNIAPEDWTSLLIAWPNHWENALMPIRGLFTEVIAESGMTYLEAFLHTANAFNCQNILTGLEGSGIDCPTVDARLMRTYFNAFQRSGFLPASQLDQQQIVRKSVIQAIPSIADAETALPLPV